MNKIIKIRLENPNLFKITYVMTTHCPYACRYCPDRLHTGEHPTIDIDSLANFVDRFADRQIVFNITGGEATTHPQFVDLITMLRNKGIKTIVDSNCVRTTRFYTDTGPLVDNWCISLHPSQHTLDLDKIRALSWYSFVVVTVLMDPLNWQTSLDWLEQLKELKNIKVVPMKIISNWAGANCNVEYTVEQEETLKGLSAYFNFDTTRLEELNETHAWLKDMISVGTREDGTEFVVNYSDIIKNNENNFNGWRCWAGNQSISIDNNGIVGWANCGIKTYKHYTEVYPQDLGIELICDRDSCECGTDIKSPKQHV